MIEYNGKRKKQPFFKCVKGVVKLFKGKITVHCIGGEIEDKCLYLANHANKLGPLLYETYLPAYCAKWGASQMLGGYKERWLYLRNVLYIQKNGWKKGKATFKATYEALFSQFFYKGIKVLPTYHDTKLIRTIKKSVDILKDGQGIMIFPEDSEEGYFDVLKSFHAGFVLLAERYYKTTGEDIPMRPVYYHAKKKCIVVGEKCYYSEYKNQGLTKTEIAEVLKNKTNELFVKIENGEFDEKKQNNATEEIEQNANA